MQIILRNFFYAVGFVCLYWLHSQVPETVSMLAFVSFYQSTGALVQVFLWGSVFTALATDRTFPHTLLFLAGYVGAVGGVLGWFALPMAVFALLAEYLMSNPKKAARLVDVLQQAVKGKESA